MIKTIEFYETYDDVNVTQAQAQQKFYNSVTEFIKSRVRKVFSKVPYATREIITHPSYEQDRYTWVFTLQSASTSTCTYYSASQNLIQISSQNANFGLKPLTGTNDSVLKFFKGSFDYIETEDTFAIFNINRFGVEGSVSGGHTTGMCVMFRDDVFSLCSHNNTDINDRHSRDSLRTVSLSSVLLGENQLYLTPLFLRDTPISNLYHYIYNSNYAAPRISMYRPINIEPIGTFIHIGIGLLKVI